MIREKWETKTSRGLISVFIFAAILLIAGGYFYLKNEEKVWSIQALKQLKNASVLKNSQVETWRQERLIDAREVFQSPFFQEAVYHWMNHPEEKRLKSEIQQRLQVVIRNNPNCLNILITDTTSRVLLTGKTGDADWVDSSTGKLIREANKTKTEIFGDLTKSIPDGKIYADIACPVFNDQQKIVGSIIFRIDPDLALFAILRAGTTHNTEEAFLFEKSGDSVLYLTNLRSFPKASLSLKFPLTNSENPAVKAVKNGPGFYEGMGYHGQKVLEYIQPVNNSPWFLSSKIDRDELFEPVYQRIKIIAIILVLLFLSFSAVVLWIISYRRRRFLHQLLEDEQQRAALKSHYEYVVKYANDIILLEDEQLNILDANQRAQQAYQYTLQELQKMKITDLVAPESKQQIETRLKNITENDGAMIDAIHRRKDGSFFHVEISARHIQIDGRTFLHQVIRDITERKQAEIALRESEERFRTTLHSTGDAIITTDLNGHIRFMNPVAETLTGWTENDASGRPIHEVFCIFNEETGEKVENPVDKVLANGVIVMLSNHTFLRSKDGREIAIGDSGAPIRDAEGKIAGVVLVFRDQTHEREAQRKIRESESHFHTLAEYSPVGIFRTRADGYTTYVNPRWCQLSGLTREEAMGNGWLKAVHPNDRDNVENGWKLDVGDEKVSVAEYRFLRSDGQIVYVLGRSVPEFDTEGNLSGFIGTITDITEQKQAQALQFRLLNIVEKSLNEIYVFDTATLKFESANRGALENLGYNLEEFQQLTPVDIKPEFTDETFRKTIEPLISGEKDKLVIETKHRRKDGSTYPVEIHLQLNQSEDKSVVLAFASDISQRLENTRALQESHERWEYLFNNSPDAIAIYQAVDDGRDFVFTDFNLQAQKTDNLSHDDVIGKRISELFPGAEQAGLLDLFRKVWRTGETEYVNSTYYKDDRINGWRENIIYKLNTGEIVAIYNDITERELGRKALIQSEEKFRNLFERHAAIKLIVDPITGNIVEANKAASAFYGYTKEELTAMNISQLNTLSPEQIQREMGKAQSMKLNFFEFRHRLKDGSIKDVAVFSSPVEIEGKEYLHSIVQDITRSKLAEKQLKLLARAIDQNPVTIMITNTDGDINYVNPKFTEVTGYSSEEVLGKNPRVLQSGEHNQEFYKDLWDTILSGNDWHGEFHDKKKNGEDYWESAVISPVFDENGEISSFVAVKEDITEKKKIIQDLIVAKEKAQESDRLKSAFLATMSHELRTPLNAVIGFSSLIDEEMPVDQITSFAQMIHSSGINLLEIVEGILDLTLLESGEMKPHAERFMLAPFMENMMKLAQDEQKKAGKPQLEIECVNLNSDEQIQLYSDPQKITKIFSHLFRNAFKFTPSGKVEFGYLIGTNGETDQIRFFVKDTGIGIPENQKSVIFERFRQADDSRTRRFGGTGIGLTIAKRKTELLGGQIWVDSEPGKGSTFYFTIPAVDPQFQHPKTTEQNNDQKKQAIFSDRTILIVEDEDSNFDLLKYMLINSDLSIVRAADGQDAVDLCLTHPEIDLVLMDINLPNLNGYEATKIIKKRQPKLPVVAVTAFAMDGDRERSLSNGCDEYLEKPINRQQLFTLLRKFLS